MIGNARLREAVGNFKSGVPVFLVSLLVWDQVKGLGGYSIYPWVGRGGVSPHTLTLFKTNIADFPTLFKTKIPKNIPWLAARPR